MRYTLFFGIAGTTTTFAFEDAPIPSQGEVVVLDGEEYFVVRRSWAFLSKGQSAQVTVILDQHAADSPGRAVGWRRG